MGHLAISGIQIRGHAMFSAEGNSLDAETLEYAWLVEAQIGDITGRLTAPQVNSRLFQILIHYFCCKSINTDVLKKHANADAIFSQFYSLCFSSH